ncbi:MAG: endonuclease III [Firmicutes bacterium]|nr:endonuclease III [Bacillota bacterium]
MLNNKQIAKVLAILAEKYPLEGECFLNYSQPYELLFATILSAQCTDIRVNQVTAVLFAKYPSLQAFAAADYDEFCEDIRSTGFFRMKAKHIIESANILLTEHNGEVPSNIDILTNLPGVGRKTANVVRGHIFEIPSIVVDTHVKRVSFRLGVTSQQKSPEKAEQELMQRLPKKNWIDYNQQIILHGRAVCTSQKPKCGVCPFSALCENKVVQ